MALSNLVFAIHTMPTKKMDSVTTMTFKNMPVRELLQWLAQCLQYNLIMSDRVTGTISLHFTNVTWQQTLDTVLEMMGFVKKEKNNILFIATAEEFAARQKSLLEAAAMRTLKIKFKHADVTTLATLLKSQPDLLSPLAKFSINPKENSLWLKENVENLPMVTDYLTQLDCTDQQIEVTAKIINIDNDKVKELGIGFEQENKKQIDRLHFSLPVATQAGGLSLAIASMAQQRLLNLQLDALTATGFGKVIANPKIIAKNRKQAMIEAGEEIPYQESTASGATNVSFKKAALSLKVTPTLLPDNNINLELEVSQNKTSSLAVNGTPAIQTQELKTDVVIHEGETLILGGIFEKSETHLEKKIPLISELPLLNRLLIRKNNHTTQKELLILIRPMKLHADNNG